MKQFASFFREPAATLDVLSGGTLLGASMTLVAYLDESGNSGDRLDSKADRYFINAGWLLDKATVTAAEDAVQRLKLRIRSQAKELKSAKLFNSPWRNVEVVNFLDELCSLGALPVFYLADRQFLIPCNISYWAADHTLCPSAPVNLDANRDYLIPFAEAIHRSLGCENRDSIARAWKERDSELLRVEMKSLYGRMLLQSRMDYALLIREFRDACDEFFRTNTAGISHHSGLYLSDAINCTLGIQLFRGLDAEAVRVNKDIELCHDEQAQFKKVFESVIARMQAMGPSRIEFPNGDAHYLGLQRTIEFSMGKSETVPLLQAADLLAGFSSQSLKRDGVESDRMRRFLAERVFAGSSESLVYLIVSRDKAGLLSEIEGEARLVEATQLKRKIDNEVQSRIQTIALECGKLRTQRRAARKLARKRRGKNRKGSRK